MYDIKALSEICHENGINVMVDNTFCTPIFQNPLLLGADFVIHSATKYLAGHSDCISGVVCGKGKKNEDLMRIIRDIMGNILG